MGGRLVLRIGAVAAVSGGLLTIVGNAIHPRERGQLDDAEHLLDVVARSELWVVDHVLIAVALALLLGAFHGLTHSITGERGSSWAGLAWGSAVIGVGLGLLFMLTEAVALAELADAWAGSSGAERTMALAAGDAVFRLSLTLAAGAAVILFGATPVLYGVAMLASGEYPDRVAWVGVAFGSLGMVAGLVQLLTGVTTVTGLVLVPIAIVGVTLWVVWLGVLMWRMSKQSERPTTVDALNP